MNFRTILALFSLLFFFQAALAVDVPSLNEFKGRLSSLNRSVANVTVPMDGDSFKAPPKNFRMKTGKLAWIHHQNFFYLPTECGNLNLSFVTVSFLLSNSLAWPLSARSPPSV